MSVRSPQYSIRWLKFSACSVLSFAFHSRVIACFMAATHAQPRMPCAVQLPSAPWLRTGGSNTAGTCALAGNGATTGARNI